MVQVHSMAASWLKLIFNAYLLQIYPNTPCEYVPLQRKSLTSH
nr:MAG TPA: hypothetical protein [Caudoviricetes sp.]DAY46296.1 MAG TPA: hypothetical protein [Caudoviricetes sp.]